MNIDLWFFNSQIPSTIGQHTTHTNISNGLVPKINIKNAKAYFYMSTFVGMSVLRNEPFIDVLNGTVIMETCKVWLFQGGGFLLIRSGIGKLLNVDFENCTSTHQILIKVIDRTLLIIEQSTFVSNDGLLIYLNTTCFGKIKHTVFRQNRVFRPGHKPYHLVGSGIYTFLQLQNCSFVNNEVHTGAVVAWIGSSIASIQQTKFVGNRVSINLGCVTFVSQGNLQVNASSFLQNTGASVCTMNVSSVAISHCLFDSNSASMGAGVQLLEMGKPLNISAAEVQTKLLCCGHLTNFTRLLKALSSRNKTQIFNCTFTENTAAQGGAIWAAKVPILVLKCLFVNNSKGPK